MKPANYLNSIYIENSFTTILDILFPVVNKHFMIYSIIYHRKLIFSAQVLLTDVIWYSIWDKFQDRIVAERSRVKKTNLLDKAELYSQWFYFQKKKKLTK